MTRSTPARPASRLGAVLVGASLLTGIAALSACSAGQVTQTDTQVAAVPGVNVNTVDGKIAVRNAVIVYAPKYPAGATMPLDLRVFNNSGGQARLTAATISDKAGGSVVVVGGASPSAPPSPSASSASPSPSVSGSKKPSTSASASPSPSPSASPSPSPTSVGSSKIDVIVPANEAQVLSPSASGGYLAIVGRTEELRAGETTTVTLTFTYGDGSHTTVTFDVPVGTPLSPPVRVSPTVRVGE